MPYECAYCDSKDAETVDHIPPKNIFRDPKPATLRTVRACLNYNAGASDDDEYFRDVILKYHRVVDLPEAQKQVRAMVRAAGKPAKRKYAQKTLSSFTLAEVTTPAGIVLGVVPGVRVDKDLFDRPIRRYVRGLYRYDTGTRLSRELHIEVVSDPAVVNNSGGLIEPILSAASKQVVQEQVFWYSWLRASDNQDAMLWLLVFFDAFPILCILNRGASASNTRPNT